MPDTLLGTFIKYCVSGKKYTKKMIFTISYKLVIVALKVKRNI